MCSVLRNEDRTKAAKRYKCTNEKNFYLQNVSLGSGFPEHGGAGGYQSGCQAAAEGLM